MVPCSFMSSTERLIFAEYTTGHFLVTASCSNLQRTLLTCRDDTKPIRFVVGHSRDEFADNLEILNAERRKGFIVRDVPR